MFRSAVVDIMRSSLYHVILGTGLPLARHFVWTALPSQTSTVEPVVMDTIGASVRERVHRRIWQKKRHKIKQIIEKI